MRRRLPSLNALRSFEAAARHLSFTEAAVELGVTQSAISRQINTLEQQLGLRLFVRLTRAIALTDEGKGYWREVRAAFDRLESATSRLSKERPCGVLTVNALPTYSMMWLVPRLPEFSTNNPDVEVRMVTSIAPADFSRGDTDLAVRVGHRNPSGRPAAAPRIDLVMSQDWAGVVREPLLPDISVPVCSPRLLNGRGHLTSAEEIGSFPLLHTATRPHAWADWCAGLGLRDFDPERRLSFGHFFMTLQAAKEGRGIAIVPRALVALEVNIGQLVIPFEAPAPTEPPYYYLLGHRARWDNPAVRSFRAWLCRKSREDVGAWPFGQPPHA